ncbi:protein lifeguard 1-like [Corticium candelabrum]|uniref:protein lifeguard 1-like n=1 Tax=Corticium candelabrum TaxID=121492 RepID=UPI002E2601E5|nr:protein lifeguard 1-like [Corticium candelabrum]
MDSDYDHLEFSERSLRMAFIRKVYAILGVQLVITTAVVLMFSYIDGIHDYVVDHPWVLYTSIAVAFILIIVLVCATNLRRTVPWNYVCLLLFTVAQSVAVGVVSSMYAREAVCTAIGLCAAITIALSIFALNTKIDFTVCSGFLFVSLIVLLLFGIFAAIFATQKNLEILNLVYASFGALIFGLYIVFDTQLMMGGKHRYSISPEEYVFAALNLYLDIINLFLMILALVGGRR